MLVIALPVETWSMRLPLVLLANNFLDRAIFLGEPLLQPMPTCREIVPLIAKPLHHVGDQGGRQSTRVADSLRKQRRRVRRALLDYFVRPSVRTLAVEVRQNSVGQPAQTLNKAEPQHDGTAQTSPIVKRRDFLIVR